MHIELIGRFLVTKYPNWQIFSEKISKLADFYRQNIKIGRFLAKKY